MSAPPLHAERLTSAARNATRGANRLRRAFDIIEGQFHTAMHNNNSISLDGF
jgi:hypothetical protein